MTVMLNNVVTVQETRGDVLSPTDYRSLVLSIKAIMIDKGYLTLHQTYRELLAHLEDIANPHQDHPNGFREELINRLFPIYVMMSSSPINKTGFTDSILPTPQYLELMLRILDNEWLYRQIKTPLGRVNTNSIIHYDPVARVNKTRTVTFDTSFDNQDEFIKGAVSHPTSDHVVNNADDLNINNITLPLLSAPEAIGLYPLLFGSRALTIGLDWSIPPQNDTLLFTLGKQEAFSVVLGADQSVRVMKNNQIILQTDPVPQALARLQFTQSLLSIITQDQVYSVTDNYLASNVFDQFRLAVPVRPLAYSKSWGLRDLLFWGGTPFNLQTIDLSAPQYLAYMQDSDGAPLIDDDGVPLFDYDVDVPDGYYLLIDEQNNAMIDTDGSFFIVPIADEQGMLLPYLPSGYKFLIDQNGNYVVDEHGAFVITIA